MKRKTKRLTWSTTATKTIYSKGQGVRGEQRYGRKDEGETFMINYDELNRELNKIYTENFCEIKGTPYEYHYLEEEHYALKRRGDFNFVIVRARSPLGAIDSLMLLQEIKGGQR